MPKQSTKNIQDAIVRLGEQLGFISIAEFRTNHKGTYSPIIDVAWLIDLDQHFDIDALKPLFGKEYDNLNTLHRFPIAGFEIEGSNTTSKNQLSNFANLAASNFFFKFVVVDNAGALKENDTYRRGVKIANYFESLIGDKQIIFSDWLHIKESIERMDAKEFELLHFDWLMWLKSIPNNETSRSAVGGETKSVPVFDSITPHFRASGLELRENHQPNWQTMEFEMNKDLLKAETIENEQLKFALRQRFYPQPDHATIKDVRTVKDAFYVPKLDLVAGFRAPDPFIHWLSILAGCKHNDVVYSPLLYNILHLNKKDLFIPLISCEIETSSNKHLNGGLINMAKNSHIGLLVSKAEGDSHISYFSKQLGLNNIYHYCYETTNHKEEQ